jgi:phosphoribosyl-AMP cyclohydrolase / phosphoribosyl-ATP pyrophosphohydrolase
MAKLDFNKGNGLIPAIIQDEQSNEVLMLGFMNEEAWKKTQDEGKVWFYSRTRKRLWMKGVTTGNTLLVRRIAVDCDQDALLIQVKPNGPVCHKGTRSCFKEKKND